MHKQIKVLQTMGQYLNIAAHVGVISVCDTNTYAVDSYVHCRKLEMLWNRISFILEAADTLGSNCHSWPLSKETLHNIYNTAIRSICTFCNELLSVS